MEENLKFAIMELSKSVVKMKRKIEIGWTDVLSFKPSFHSHDESGILEVELSKRPTFFTETNPQSRKHTQWKQTDQDFTQEQFASKCRRHTLQFAPGVLQKNLEKLLSSHSFWSELIKVNSPSLQDPYFENGFGNVGVGELNFNMANQYCFNDGRQMNSFVQDNLENNIANQLNGAQVISQPINEHYDIGRYISESQFNNPMIQDDIQLLGSQVYPQALLEPQTNSMHMNDDFSVYPEIGPYPQSFLAQEGDMQNMEHTHLDGNFQSNMMSFNQLGDYDYYDQYFSNNNGLMPPDL